MPHFSPLIRHTHKHGIARHASVLSPAHLQRQRLERNVQQQQQQQLLRLTQAQAQQQQQQMQQQGARTIRRPRIYHFRHQGTPPWAPQALGHLEFVLSEQPLDGLLVPRAGAAPASVSSSSSSSTAAVTAAVGGKPLVVGARKPAGAVQAVGEQQGRERRGERPVLTAAAVGAAAGVLGAAAVTLLAE
ncbi:hypothetical protein LPJ53_001164 [Coemansia erecta]|uniref:Uncharacterized protein n=1 Tax=Coemansia erecta TaxID=147472 RepID=A0A9W7Y0J6_9FUNG|nr:hypothetical protein LPJ53_001164 [Coemansia erecta]